MQPLKHFVCFLLLIILSACTNQDKPETVYDHGNNGTLLATLSEDGTHALLSTLNDGIQWRKLNEKETLFHWEHQKGIHTIPTAMSIAKNAPFAATLDKKSMIIWDTELGDSKRFFALPSPATSVALSQTGKYALVGFVDNTAKLYNLAEGNELRVFKHADRVTAVALSPNGQFAAIGSSDTAVRVWDLNTGTMLSQWFHPGKINHLAFSHDNTKLLSASSMKKAWIHNLNDTNADIKLHFHAESFFTKSRPFTLTSSAFSPTAKIIITGHPQSMIAVWDYSTGKLLKRISIPKETWYDQTPRIPLALIITPDGKRIVCECSNGKAYQFILKL